MTGPILDRILTVSAGPAGAPGLTWKYPLHIKAKMELTSTAAPSKAEIEISNLGQNSISLLEGKGIEVIVSAGTGAAGVVFKGELLAKDVKHKREGADWITTITPRDGGRKWLDSWYFGSLPAGSTWGAILSDAIAALGLPLGFLGPNFPAAQVRQAPWICAEPARYAISSICDGLPGCFWFIDSGKVIVLGPSDTWTPIRVPLISPETGMIGSPEREGAGSAAAGSVKAKCLYLPELRPGMPYVLKSRHISGGYRATKALGEIDSYGQIWQSAITGRVA